MGLVNQELGAGRVLSTVSVAPSCHMLEWRCKGLGVLLNNPACIQFLKGCKLIIS